MPSALILACSPRRNGNSDFAAALLCASLPMPVRIVRLADKQIKPCHSCGYCSINTGKCSLDDPEDYAENLFGAMRKATLTIFVSPVYFYHLPAQAKAFIDRSQRFYGAPHFAPKSHMAAILIGARQQGDTLFEGASRTLRYFAKGMGMEWLGSLGLYGLDKAGDLENNPDQHGKIRSFALDMLAKTTHV